MSTVKKNRIFQNSQYNIWGTFFYFFCQWVTTIFVVRFADFSSAGIYSLAISFSNLFGFVARYGVRNYQISDIQHNHTDATYFATRGVTSALALGIFLIVLLFVGFSSEVLLSSNVLFLYKILESTADVFFGVYQKLNRYDAIAITQTIKGLVPLVVFAGTLWAKLGITVACFAMAIAYLLTLLLYDLPVILRSKGFTCGVSIMGIRMILRACFPLMAFSLVNPYITFITRYSIERLFSEDVLGYYSSISLVVVVMSTLAGSIFAVIVPQASALHQKGDVAVLKWLILRIILGIMGVTILLLLAGALVGEWGLVLIFGQGIKPYSYLLLPMIGVSAMLTLVAFFSSTLTAFQKRIPVLLANLVGAALCTIIAWPLAKTWGMLGACISMASAWPHN